MLRHLTVLALLAVCLARAAYYTEKVADQDFLLKQKKVYQLLWHISQPDIVNPALYQEGKAYSIEANIDSYTNKDAVKEFLEHYQMGMLPRGRIFSMFYPKMLHEFIPVFKVLYYAKDFDTFYKTGLWLRIHVNEGMFCIALYQAVLFRPDTEFLQLPPIYEMYPFLFFNSEVLEKAHHARIFGKPEPGKTSGGHETYVIPANYSGWYLTREYDYEQRLNYFTEDIGLNSYYYYFRNNYPMWLKLEEMGFSKPYRGDEYLYGHRQILARYYLERLSNDLGNIEDFDWNREFYPGYYPTMVFHNGLPLPQRLYYSKIPFYKFKYLKQVQEIESRIMDALDTGYVLEGSVKEAKRTNIYTPEGLNVLGNLIEGNMDSCNKDYYGSFDVFSRKILGFNVEPSAATYEVYPSALEYMMANMRDPAFYRIYNRIIQFYERYKMHMGPYKKDEIFYPDLKIESMTVDKLLTYFDHFDSDISNGLAVESQKEAETYAIKIRQHRLNHKPFTVRLSVNSDRTTTAVVRFFMGPKYDVNKKPLDFSSTYKFFYEMDNFMVNLTAGANKIERTSHEFFFLSHDQESSDLFWKRLSKALEGGEQLKFQERVYGFPERLLLPKGTKDGMTVRFFAYISPLEGKPVTYTSRIFGSYDFDTKPFGFPLDRPVYDTQFNAPNMYFKDVTIFHKDEHDYSP